MVLPFQYAAVAAADAVEKLVEWLAAAVAVVVAFAFAPGVAVAWFAVVRLAVAAVVDFAGSVAAAVIGVVVEPVAERVDVVDGGPVGAADGGHHVSSEY